MPLILGRCSPAPGHAALCFGLQEGPLCRTRPAQLYKADLPGRAHKAVHAHVYARTWVRFSGQPAHYFHQILKEAVSSQKETDCTDNGGLSSCPSQRGLSSPGCPSGLGVGETQQRQPSQVLRFSPIGREDNELSCQITLRATGQNRGDGGYPHFGDKETEAQKGLQTCLGLSCS